MKTLETMKVIFKNGIGGGKEFRINKIDFNPKKHLLPEDAEKEKAKAKKKAAAKAKKEAEEKARKEAEAKARKEAELKKKEEEKKKIADAKPKKNETK
jgi:hypothetical protein